MLTKASLRRFWGRRQHRQGPGRVRGVQTRGINSKFGTQGTWHKIATNEARRMLEGNLVKSLEWYYGKFVFYPVQKGFSKYFGKRILLKKNLICIGALYTASTHQPDFTLWPRCFFRRANLIFLLLGTHTSKISHQAWSKMPCFCRLWWVVLPTLPLIYRATFLTYHL